MKVSWESYPCGNFHYKCCYFPYGCDKCIRGRFRNGEIRLHITIAGRTFTTIATLGHEFLHFLIWKLHLPNIFNYWLDHIDRK